MAERFPDDGEAANGFERRFLHEWEARLLHEANYPTLPDMRVPRAWRLSTDGILVPSPPSCVERDVEIARIRESLLKDAH
ncbi:hypothetical protein D1007_15034 [Hordeum vulgare]|nr:hypothetical protein D1007_15034 [Hordeum vulgare]